MRWHLNPDLPAVPFLPVSRPGRSEKDQLFQPVSLYFSYLQVSLGSSISAFGPVASAEINFPSTTRGLLQWARREHGGVTSLAEYHGVNTIYTRLRAGMGSKCRYALREKEWPWGGVAWCWLCRKKGLCSMGKRNSIFKIMVDKCSFLLFPAVIEDKLAERMLSQ